RGRGRAEREQYNEGNTSEFRHGYGPPPNVVGRDGRVNAPPVAHRLPRHRPTQRVMHRVVTLATFALAIGVAPPVSAQQPKPVFTHADTLRGSNGPGRSWWDASFYD